MANKKSPAHFAKQAQEAYELSIAGYSQRQIAEKMGVALATVQRRLDLYITDHTMPKADEYRKRQIARLELYIRSLWTQINNGDPKAIAAAVRTEERIAKLMGTDSAQLFKVEAAPVSRESDANDAQKLLDQFFGANPDERRRERPAIKGEVITTNGHTRPRRPRQPRKPITYTAPPVDEFAAEADATLEEFDIEEPEPAPRPRRKGQPVQNPAERFLRDNDDD
ncbi:sigma-70 region 4 domain-containing protein [Streptomyces sp. DH1]|uniref:sigma-70 region 4 domain-containing protein n=1 Tax=Streptomyces sp. DH1 TaxID=2857012 RepID=UPI001E566EA4|nr:sigma-70 region 4 domain-containing protein [Streptomyces sp. DH1]